MKTDLSHYDNSWYNPGGETLKRILWYFTNALFFINPLNPFSGIRVCLLRLFGAKIGKKVVIKPGGNIKYPWNLSIGDYSWIGENVWIDNLTHVTIGSNVCISQGAMLLCGNHDYKRPTFDLMVKSIVIENGAWVGAQSTVCPGVTMHSHSVLAVGSIASKDLMPYSIYRGNPAVKVAERVMFES
ncbi:WcaF family extracellular polysaccharide biosynthesis acetyltransferase [Parabacteroides sp.]